MLIEILCVIVLALANGFFALSEMALMTARQSRLKQLARDSRRAQIALELTRQPEDFLATVQVFITLLQISAGAALGASLGDHIGRALDVLDLPALDPYALGIGIALSITGITFLNMLLGELAPKRIAITDPERFAIGVAMPMRAMTWLARPFAYVLIQATQLLLRLLRMNGVHRARVSEEEIRLLVAESADQGVIDVDERNMVNRVLRLGDRSVDSLMTPRPRIAWLDATATGAENLALMRERPFSRYPVYRGDEREVLGVLELKRAIGRFADAQAGDLLSPLRAPLYVPGTLRALDLLEEFRDSETTLALVVDEYGDIIGLVTLNDLLGAVVGRAATSTARRLAQPIVLRADGSWLVDGGLGVDDLRELLGLAHLPGEGDHDFNTTAGLVMAHWGRIPQVGEHFDAAGYRFEVVDLDGARIDKVLISAQP
ncbi:hemolysin family protein [Dokdonella sp.]|uniref:hemolysin family protein n=1 Tax=Dokdonella sp. TaxID=2291710 RepID=UPI0025C4B67E|nr:hemolysin family protein [Dokdonella sp.]MBX3690484.1 HlyC/CorC family transporter [Dokdonella sp.]